MDIKAFAKTRKGKYTIGGILVLLFLLFMGSGSSLDPNWADGKAKIKQMGNGCMLYGNFTGFEYNGKRGLFNIRADCKGSLVFGQLWEGKVSGDKLIFTGTAEVRSKLNVPVKVIVTKGRPTVAEIEWRDSYYGNGKDILGVVEYQK